LGLSKSLVRYFSNLRSKPNTALPHLVPVISPLCALRHPALRTPAIAGAAEADSRLASARVWRPARFLFSYSLAHSCLSPFSIASSPPFTPSLARCSLISCQWQPRLKGETLLPVRIAIPACAIVSSSPAPDSPIAIYYVLPHSLLSENECIALMPLYHL
jgi:hypothetical protein